MKLTIKDRVDLYTDDGEYLFSVMKGCDEKWRRCAMYRDSGATERIGNIEMVTPDYQNNNRMNLTPNAGCVTL
jgi:hypothetical protein